MPDFDVENLIYNVKQFPELWDTNSKYSNIVGKRCAWLEICRIMDKSFEQKSKKDKEEFEKTVMKKWKNIKDNFFKSLRKQHKNSGVRDYIYSPQLRFLVPSMKAAASHSSYEEEEEEEEEEREEEEEEEEDEDEEDEKPTTLSFDLLQTPETTRSAKAATIAKKRKLTSKSSDKPDLQSSLLEFPMLSMPSASDSTSSRCAAKSNFKTSIDFDLDSIPTASDVNLSRAFNFFKSITSTVDEFDTDQFLEFQLETLNAIKKIRRK